MGAAWPAAASEGQGWQRACESPLIPASALARADSQGGHAPTRRPASSPLRDGVAAAKMRPALRRSARNLA
eukprot:11205813-Lingulodinium_polyedra.AAC.1